MVRNHQTKHENINLEARKRDYLTLSWELPEKTVLYPVLFPVAFFFGVLGFFGQRGTTALPRGSLMAKVLRLARQGVPDRTYPAGAAPPKAALDSCLPHPAGLANAVLFRPSYS